VTLVEMLVTLAVLLLMMTAIVKVFQAATGSLSSAQAYQELDNQLRLLDSTIRSDLTGVTATMTPPNDPNNNKGYFEYGENEFADLQGEDSDDYIRFTAKAPAGRPFTGRIYVPPLIVNGNLTALNANFQPITITSEYAEIIYFLRNGNLYRRVLLVAPERQSTIVPSHANLSYGPNVVAGSQFLPIGLGGLQVSWQGVNDLSAHPAPSGQPTVNAPDSVILNTLGDLTNRENRFAYPRFGNDFLDLTGSGAPNPDGLVDDFNRDNVPDYYPTLYPGVFNPINLGNRLIFEPPFANANLNRPNAALLAFPYVFPGAYSRAQILSTNEFGWIHSPNPQVNVGTAFAPVAVTYEGNANGTTLDYLRSINHNPLDAGDNLRLPTSQTGYERTWWGFPTWRETLSPFWTDPTVQVNLSGAPIGLNPLVPGPGGEVINGLVDNTGVIRTLLPAMTTGWRNTPQPYNDGWGGNNNSFFPANNTALMNLWSSYGWEDDLVMTGVRSFDIKAYDNALAAYADLGWGDDPRQTGLLSPQFMNTGQQLPYLAGNWDVITKGYNAPAYANISGGMYNVLGQTFAHEGRMPPLQNDNRLDASYPNPNYTNWSVPYPNANYTYVPQYPNFTNYSGNVGDSNNGIVRLRRVWDSWSTDYSRAPANGVNNTTGFPVGPPYWPPIYPSYPPPYPAPLRGIQIQIRVTDPTNQRIKTLTIRQDFTDKL